jgi:hypothetical protein
MYEYIYEDDNKEAEKKKDVTETISQKYMILVLTEIIVYLFRNSICLVAKIKLGSLEKHDKNIDLQKKQCE